RGSGAHRAGLCRDPLPMLDLFAARARAGGSQHGWPVQPGHHRDTRAAADDVAPTEALFHLHQVERDELARSADLRGHAPAHGRKSAVAVCQLARDPIEPGLRWGLIWLRHRERMTAPALVEQPPSGDDRDAVSLGQQIIPHDRYIAYDTVGRAGGGPLR